MREFIVEADGGSRGNPGPAGYGSVVIDAATGETLVETAEYIGVATNNVAEYKGLVAGLKAAHQLDPGASVHVRMDSKLVVEQMSGRWKIKHPDMKPLAAQAARVFPASQVTYEWIPREKNKHADRLANEAMDAGKRGLAWSPSASTADLDTRAARAAAAREPSGPPGDAAAGAARARAALAGVSGDGAAPAGTVSAGAGASGTSEAAGTGEAADRRAASSAASSTAGSTAGSAASTGARTPPVGWAAPADLGAPATFVLLRHGETALTPEKRFSGSGGTDPSLSGVGREQAQRAAAAFAARGTIQAIVSSPIKRCQETAYAVAARLGLDVHLEEGLRETDFGAWEGLTFGEVRERHPEELTAWLASPKAAPPGGESFATVSRRVAATRDRLTAEYAGRTVLLVTHVTPIKTLVRLALGAPPESLFRMELAAASVSAVAYYRDGNASLRLLNDTSHLR
ncbi:bifunctional RNase H/acid phosphatase [Streptomyces sp. BG9H]|uniref:Bifunctional RNase H/acid phosphatase n=1 Tax=Streptomyces anatolicus TaxID=2675858 RepID=A0ABS6YUX8_9ACTN|nr:bifunctional RNase H/acid phosphatase [Streptomyces anatolicus]MBW5424346.1 bifunctional RNase H/acid phosphatase [Streptomyces anatolicus]